VVTIATDFEREKPWLTRPGPQPHNRIAATALEQFARVFTPRAELRRSEHSDRLARDVAEAIRAHPELILLELLRALADRPAAARGLLRVLSRVGRAAA
jgi:hypothetical protein